MIQVVFPVHQFKIKEESGRELIFDDLRKQWVRLSPEEWVRQNFIQYLVQVRQYPAALIGVEKEIKLGELKKRFDVLVFDTQYKPWMIVECKAMDVHLDETVLQQVLRYHLAIPAEYLVITNGSFTNAYHKQDGKLLSLHNLPVFPA